MEVVVEAHDVTDKEENVVETRESPRSGENHMVFPVSGFVESLSRFGKMQMRANLKQIFVLTNFPPEFSWLYQKPRQKQLEKKKFWY